MSLTTNLSNAFTRAATEDKALRTLINGNVPDLSSLSTTAKNSLVAAINEVFSTASNPVGDLDDLTDVTIAGLAVGHILRYSGTEWANVDGSTYYQPRDSDLDSIAALTTTAYGRGFLSLANQAALMGLLSAASATAQGIVELATTAETTTGTDTTRAVTPAGVKAATDALSTVYQPLDTDLSSIAALATTPYGRALLTLADQAALMGLIPAASETVQGKVELATVAEATAGTDTARAVTPAGVAAVATNIKNDILGGAGAAYDTLQELKALLDASDSADDAAITAINTALGFRVRVDAPQSFTAGEKTQGRANIDAASATDVGDTNTNFVTIFEAGLV